MRMTRVCMLGCGGLRALKGRCVSGLEGLCGGGGGEGAGLAASLASALAARKGALGEDSESEEEDDW